VKKTKRCVVEEAATPSLAKSVDEASTDPSEQVATKVVFSNTCNKSDGPTPPTPTEHVAKATDTITKCVNFDEAKYDLFAPKQAAALRGATSDMMDKTAPASPAPNQASFVKTDLFDEPTPDPPALVRADGQPSIFNTYTASVHATEQMALYFDNMCFDYVFDYFTAEINPFLPLSTWRTSLLRMDSESLLSSTEKKPPATKPSTCYQNESLSRSTTDLVVLSEAAEANQRAGSVALGRTKIPSTTDVLSGRGGPVNNHPGNFQFREFVKKRKDDYAAGDRKQRVQICREVIAQVYGQTPPGRFLAKESRKSPWWVELDDDRIMAKTSQALREGAPTIRKATVKPSQQAEYLPTNMIGKISFSAAQSSRRAKKAKASAAAKSSRQATASTAIPFVQGISCDDNSEAKDKGAAKSGNIIITSEGPAMLLYPSATVAEGDAKPPTKNKHWSKAEDELLKFAVHQEGGPPHNWQQISVNFNGIRTAKQVRSLTRYAALLTIYAWFFRQSLTPPSCDSSTSAKIAGTDRCFPTKRNSLSPLKKKR
jgi:hypothetical protein